MTSRPSWASHTAHSPLPFGNSEPTSIGVAYYRTDHELTFYLRALQRFRSGRLVVVLGLKERKRVLPANMPTSVRVILTALGNDINPDEAIGWFVPEPLQAVAVAMTGLRPNDGLILLFPADLHGDSPDSLIEKAKCRLAALAGSAAEPCSE